MQNLIPKTPSIINLDLLGSNKIRVAHSIVEDYDASSIACYLYVVNSGEPDFATNNNHSIVYMVELGDLGYFEVDLPWSATDSEEYVVQIATVDDFVDEDSEATGGSISRVNSSGVVYNTSWLNSFVTNRDTNVLNYSAEYRFTSARGSYISDIIQVVPDSFSSSTPSYLNVFLDDSNAEIDYIEVSAADSTAYDGSTNTGLSFSVLYTGRYLPLITLDEGTGLTSGTPYVFRVRTRFTDGTFSGIEYYDTDPSDRAAQHPYTQIIYNEGLAAPIAPDTLEFEAFTDWNGTPSYDLLVKWNWPGTEANLIKNFEIEYIEKSGMGNSTDLSAQPETWWDNSLSVFAGSGNTSTLLTAFPPAKKFAFRIRSVGWGAEADRYSEWAYGKVYLGDEGSINFDIIPSNEQAPSGTNIQIDKYYIRTYNNWNGSSGDITFQVDASTGDVQIGKDAPFFFDASSNVLTVEGSTIVNDITAASIILDWVDGTAPKLKTSTKTDYATGGSGIWAGYTDDSTFKFDLGNAQNYMRWDGSDLTISGSVKIIGGGTSPGDIGYINFALSSTHYVVIFDSNDDPVNDTTIIVSALTNDSNIANYTWEVVRAGTNTLVGAANLTKVTDTQYTLQVTAANNVMATGYDAIEVRAFDGSDYATSTYKDFVTIGRVNEGAQGVDPIFGYLTNESATVPSDANGVVSSFTGAVGNFKVFDGESDVTASATFSEVSETSLTGTIGTDGSYSVTSLSADTGSYTIRAVYSGITIDKVFNVTKSRAGTAGTPGSEGPQGTRGPIFAPGQYAGDPDNDAIWGGAGTHAYDTMLALGGGVIVQYDVLTLRNSSDSSQAETRMWDGSSWVEPNLIDGDQVITGTLAANRIAATEAFFEEIGVNVIYNHGANDSNYKMKIDFQSGFIHIRG